MFNSKHSNRYFAVSVAASLATSVLVVLASLAGAVDRMQAFVWVQGPYRADGARYDARWNL